MSKINLSQYKTLVFDCDGVILNSNKIKTQAFYDVVKAVYGHNSAQKLKEYHIRNGGISRYEKFEYLFTNILQKPVNKQEFSEFLFSFSKEVKRALLSCEIAEGIKEFRDKTSNSKWLIVSGGDQEELREVFKKRDLDSYFDGGIFGSPNDKDTILKNETKNRNIIGKSLFLGDSMYDYQTSSTLGMDFIFLSAWTDFYEWEVFFKEKKIQSFNNLQELIDL